MAVTSPYVNFTFFDDVPRIGIAHYEIESVDSLKEKLLQFPKGTVFKLKTVNTRGDEFKSEEVFQQIKSYLEEHGMKLKREPGP